MSGWANGVQSKIREKVPHAPYVHCHAHRLKMVFVDSKKYVQSVSKFSSLIQALYKFISTSNTRHVMFLKAQRELGKSVLELEQPSETRWFYYHR